MPATVVAEAGSQPMPSRPMMALASAISCSLTVMMLPCERRTARSAFFHETGAPIFMAVASVRGFATGVDFVRKAIASAAIVWHGFRPGKQMRERGCAFGLNDAEFRQAIDQAEAKHFVETFSERGAIAHVSAGNDHVIRNAPVALLQEFEGDGLLPFDAKRIDGIGDVNRRLIGKLSNQAHAIVEISRDFANDRRRSPCSARVSRG